MNTLEQIGPDARRHARHVIGIDGDDQDVQTADLLRRLSESEYCLASDLADAMQVLVDPKGLASRPNVIDRADFVGRKQGLETAVASFAESFFTLPNFDRRLRWQELAGACCNVPHLRRWLKEMQTGLEVERIPVLAGDGDNNFVKRCCEAFVSRPLERARIRQELIIAYSRIPGFWQDVAWALQSQDRSFEEGVAGYIFDQPETEPLDELQQISRQRDTEPSVLKSKSTGESRSWVAVALVGLAIARLLAGANRPSTSSDSQRVNRPVPYVVPYNTPTPIPKPIADPPRDFNTLDDDERRRFAERLLKHAPEDQTELLRKILETMEQNRQTTGNPMTSEDGSSPFQTPEQKNAAAGLEATRIIMGIPENTSPLQREQILRGSQFPPPSRSPANKSNP